MNRRRLLAILLSFAMLLSMMPAAHAFAGDDVYDATITFNGAPEGEQSVNKPSGSLFDAPDVDSANVQEGQQFLFWWDSTNKTGCLPGQTITAVAGETTYEAIYADQPTINAEIEYYEDGTESGLIYYSVDSSFVPLLSGLCNSDKTDYRILVTWRYADESVEPVYSGDYYYHGDVNADSLRVPVGDSGNVQLILEYQGVFDDDELADFTLTSANSITTAKATFEYDIPGYDDPLTVTRTSIDGGDIVTPGQYDLPDYPYGRNLLGWTADGGETVLEPGEVITGLITDTTYTALYEDTGDLHIELGYVQYAPETDMFTVTVTLDDTTVNGNFDDGDGDDSTYVTFTNGVATFDLPARIEGSTSARSIYGLPAGVGYTIEITPPGGGEDYALQEGFLNTATGTISMGSSESHAFYYNYTAEITVSYLPGEGATGEMDPAVLKPGGWYALPEPEDVLFTRENEDDGMYFIGWYKNGDTSKLYVPGTQQNISEDTTFTAAWSDKTFTVTVKPGYMYAADSDELIELTAENYSDYETRTYTGYRVGQFTDDNPDFKVAVAGTEEAANLEGDDTALIYEIPTEPEGLGFVNWEAETWVDGEHEPQISYSAEVCSAFDINGNLVLYPIYNYIFDITMDYNIDDVDDVTIYSHPSGAVLSNEYDLTNYRYGAENSAGEIHVGWFIDKNSDGALSEGEALVYDYSDPEQSTPRFYKADFAGLDTPTITALWKPGFVVEYKNGEDSLQKFYYTDEQTAEAGYTVQTKEAFELTDDPYRTFQGWAVDGAETLYQPDETITDDTSSKTFTAVWNTTFKVVVKDDLTGEEIIGSRGFDDPVIVYYDDDTHIFEASCIGEWPEGTAGAGPVVVPVDENGDPIEGVSPGMGTDYGALHANNSTRVEGGGFFPLEYDTFLVEFKPYVTDSDPFQYLEEGKASFYVTFVEETRPVPFILKLTDSYTSQEYDHVNELTIYPGEEHSFTAGIHSGELPENANSENPYRWTVQELDDGEPVGDVWGDEANDDTVITVENIKGSSAASTFRLTLMLYGEEEWADFGTDHRVVLDITFSESGDNNAAWQLVRKNADGTEEIVYTLVDDASYDVPMATDLYLRIANTDEVSWEVFGYGSDGSDVYDNGYSGVHAGGDCGDFWLCQDDQPYGTELSLSELFAHVTDAVRYRFTAGGYSLTLNVMQYDYAAAIVDAAGVIEDLNSYAFTASSEVTFAAQLTPDYEDTYSWSWDVAGTNTDYSFTTDGGETDRLIADNLSTQTVFALNPDETNWTVKVYAVDAEGNQISSEARLSFVIEYEGPFQLGIDNSWLDGEFDYVGDATDKTVDLSEYRESEWGDYESPSLHARYRGQHSNESFNITSYAPIWSLHPLDENMQPLDGATPVTISDSGSDWDSYYVDANTIQDELAGTDYAANEYFLLTLSIDDESTLAAQVNIRVEVRRSLSLTATKGDETFDLDTPFNKSLSTGESDTVTFTPSITPALDGVSYKWDVIGSNNGYDNGLNGNTTSELDTDGTDTPTLPCITLHQLLLMDPNESQWNVTLKAYDENGSQIGDSYHIINITLYDYTASITAIGEDGQAVTDLENTSFGTSDSLSFSAALNEEYEDEITWSWDAYGSNTDCTFDGADRFEGDTLTLAQITAQNGEETQWHIYAYAVDKQTGEQLSPEAEITVNVYYDGAFYLKIKHYGEQFAGMDNYCLARGWGDYNAVTIGTVAGADGETLYPRWELTPLDEYGSPLKDYSYVVLDSAAEDWEGYVHEWEVGHSAAPNGNTPTSDGYATMLDDYVDGGYRVDHLYWRLTLKAQDEAGNVYDPNNETGYMASVFIDNSNPLELGIARYNEEDSGWVTGTENSATAESYDYGFYSVKLGDAPEGYNTPYWTATPVDESGAQLADKSFRVTPEQDGWSHYPDEYDEQAYRSGFSADTLYEQADEHGCYEYYIWYVTLQAADENGNIYTSSDPKEKAISGITVTFTDMIPEEPEYECEIKIVNTDTGVVYETDSEGATPTIWIPTGTTELNLRADFYVNGVLQDDTVENVDYRWAWLASGENGSIAGTGGGIPEEEQAPAQTTRAASFAEALATQGMTALTISPSAMYLDENGESICAASMNLWVAFTDEVKILYPNSHVDLEPYKAGEEVTLEVKAINAEGYQWYHQQYESGYTPIDGATESKYSFTATLDNYGEYVCAVTGKQTVDGQEAEVTLNDPTTQLYVDYFSVRTEADVVVPEEIMIDENGSATLNILSISPDIEGYTYQWYRDHEWDFTDDEPVSEQSASSELTINDAEVNARYYCVVFYNNAVNVQSETLMLTSYIDPTAPFMERGAERYEGYVGDENFTMTVTVKNMPDDAAVMWTKYGDVEPMSLDPVIDDSTITGATTNSYTDENGLYVCELIFANLAEENEGFYGAFLVDEDGNNYPVVNGVSSANVFLEVQEAPAEPEPEPESGVKFTVNGTTYEHGATVNVAPNADIVIQAQGFGDAATYAISYLVDNEAKEATDGVLTLNYTTAGTHTVSATATNTSLLLMLLSMDNGDGSFTGSITLNVTEPVISGENVLVDPNDPADINNPTNIDVTGILKDNEEFVEPTIYSVELNWGAMAFQYVTTTTTNKTWDSTSHEWSSSNGGSSEVWELISKDALNLPDAAKPIFSGADQSYVVVFNHSNAPVNVAMTNTAEQTNYNVAAALKAVSGGVGASSATDTAHAYTLAKGIENQVYDATTGTAAKIELSGTPDAGISEDAANASLIAKLTITLSKVQ